METVVIYIPARGNGRSMAALVEAIERAEKLREMEKAAQTFTISPNPEELIEKMGPNPEPMSLSELSLEALDREAQPAAGVDKRIRALKKELKHAKNPIELKRINQELSAAYAEKRHPERNPYRREVEGKW